MAAFGSARVLISTDAVLMWDLLVDEAAPWQFASFGSTLRVKQAADLNLTAKPGGLRLNQQGTAQHF